MKAILITSIILLGIVNAGIAQYVPSDNDDSDADNTTVADRGSFRDKLYVGGNLGFNIFNRILVLDVAPIVGYRVTDRVSLGVGARINYSRDLDFDVSASHYGGSIFGRYRIFPTIFLHSELEILQSYDYDFNSPNYLERAPAYMWFVGGGYTSGGSVSFNIMLLYDLIDHPNSPYQFSYITGNSGLPVILRMGVRVNL